MTRFAGDIYRHVNCYGIAGWLDGLLKRIGRPFPSAAPDPECPIHTARSWGMILTLGRAPQTQADWREEIVLLRVEGDTTASIPFRLDPASETLDTAKIKLSQNTAGGSAAEIASGDRRVSFFLDEGRLIELTFNDGMRGFERYLIAGLGAPRDWRQTEEAVAVPE